MKKLIFLPLLLIFSTCFGLTRADIRDEIRFRVHDSTTTNNPIWSDTVLNRRINMENRRIAIFTRALYSKTTSNITVGQAEYDRPATAFTVDRVSYRILSGTSSYRKLVYSTQEYQDRERQNWENLANGRPLEYYERDNKIGLVPPPSSTYNLASALKIEYFKIPADMDADTDEPWDSRDDYEQFHDIIILGVKLMCLRDRWKFGEANIEEERYRKRLEEMKEYVAFKPDANDGRRAIKFRRTIK